MEHTAVQRRPETSRGLRLQTIGRRAPMYAFIVFFAGIVVAPVAALVVRALIGGGFARLADYPGIGEILLNTATLALGSLVIATVLGVSLALCVKAAPPSWQGVLGIVPIIPLVVPGVADTLGWIFLLAPRTGYLNSLLRALPWFAGDQGPVNIYSFPWIVILTGFSLTGFVYLYVSNSLNEIGGELQAAAKVAGASPFRIFRTVTLPLLTPALTYSSGIVLLMGLGQFTNPLLLGQQNRIQVLTTVLYYQRQEYPVDYALGAATSAPLIIAGLLILLAQRKALADQRKFTVVTGKSTIKPGLTSPLAAVPVVLFGLIAVVLPITSLVIVACSPYWSGTIAFDQFTTTHFAEVFTNHRTLDAFVTTIQAIAISLLIVIPVGLVSAMIQRGRIKATERVRAAADLFTTIPMVMPAAILGFAMLFVYSQPPFRLYGTVMLFVLTYVTLMIPHATRPILSTMIATGPEFTEAATTSGASRWRILLTVDLPMLRGGISTAITMVVILLFHEFAASLMVAAAGTQTVGALLYDYYASGVYPEVAAIALLLVVVTFVGVSISVMIGGRKAMFQ